MVQVIGQGRVQPKSFGQQIGEGVSRLASGTADHFVDRRERGLQEKKQQEQIQSLSRLTGMDLSGITDEKVLQNIASNFLKPQQDNSKDIEKSSSLEGALERVQSMKNIRKRNNLGIGTSIRGIFDPKARKDQGEYETLGKSLIQYVSTIPIRNRQEFEALAHDLYDPSVSDDKAEGILTRLQEIIEDGLRPYEKLQGGTQKNERSPLQSRQEKPPLTSFMR